jgi:hypothetical protein
MCLALWLAGCTAYSHMEHYLCVSPFASERCKNPPYYYSPYPPDARTKDDAVPPP